MKIILSAKKPLSDFHNVYSSSRKYTFDTEIGSDENSDRFLKFWQAFDRKCGNRNWPITVDFNLSDVSVPIDEDEPLKKWEIIIKSDTLKAIHHILCYGNPDTNLKLEVKVQCTSYNRSYGQTSVTAVINADEFFPKKDDMCTVMHDCYLQTNLPLPKAPVTVLNGHPVTNSWSITIEVKGDDFICLANIFPSFPETNRKIFSNRKFCDFEIISDNGTSIPCHRIYLCAKSPVLTVTCDGKFKEAKEQKMEMGMSTQGVIALLEYLYCDDVYQAIVSCEIALELLQAAEEYDIPILWKAVATILIERSHAWFEVDVALKLFQFVSKLDHRKENKMLMKKMIQVLALKSEQLSESSLYRVLFPTVESREILGVSLESNKPEN